MYSEKFVQNKASLFGMLAALCLVLSGCVGFTEDWFTCSDADAAISGHSEEAPKIDSPDSFSALQKMIAGSLQVDSASNTLMMIVDFRDTCVESGSSFALGLDDTFPDTLIAEFGIEDYNLVLSPVSEVYRIVFADGEDYKLYAIWRQLYFDTYPAYWKFDEDRFEIRILGNFVSCPVYKN